MKIAEKLKNKKIIIILIVVIVAVVGAGIFLYNKYKKPELTSEQIKLMERQREIDSQLESSRQLREQNNYQPPTEEEVKQQLKTSEILRKENNYQPPTQEEIKQRLEESRKLREQNQ